MEKGGFLFENHPHPEFCTPPIANARPDRKRTACEATEEGINYEKAASAKNLKSLRRGCCVAYLLLLRICSRKRLIRGEAAS